MSKSYFLGFIWLTFLLTMSSCRKKKISLELIQRESGTDYDLTSVYFVNEQTGYITGGLDYEKSIILKTTDGGNTWLIVDPGGSQKLNAVFFINTDTGFAIGDQLLIKRTTDGGNNWQDVNKALSYDASQNVYLDANAISFTDSLKGFIICGESYGSGIILKTTDGGLNWTDITESICPECRYTAYFNKDYLNHELNTIFFIDPQNGYIAGYGILLKTTDGGNTWLPQNTSSDGFFRSIGFANNSIGIIAGYNSLILRTTDGGQNWKNVYNLTTQYRRKKYLEAAYFIDENRGYVVGDGVILHTYNSGEGWSQYKSDQHYFNSISSTKAGRIFLVGKKGLIMEINNY